LDSGATDHLVNDEKLFMDYIDLESPKIAVAKHGEFIFATKRGIVRLHNRKKIPLENVLHYVAENLISVKRRQEAGMTYGIMFGSNGVKILWLRIQICSIHQFVNVKPIH